MESADSGFSILFQMECYRVPISGRFDLPSTVQSFFAHKYKAQRASDADAGSLASQRSRQARLKADQAERVAQKESGELIPASEIASAWLAVINTSRTRLLLVPRKIAPRVVNGTVVEAERLMQKEINATLAELAATPV